MKNKREMKTEVGDKVTVANIRTCTCTGTYQVM